MIKLEWDEKHQESRIKTLKAFNAITREEQLYRLEDWIDHLTSIRKVISRLHMAQKMKEMGIGNDSTK